MRLEKVAAPSFASLSLAHEAAVRLVWDVVSGFRPTRDVAGVEEAVRTPAVAATVALWADDVGREARAHVLRRARALRLPMAQGRDLIEALRASGGDVDEGDVTRRAAEEAMTRLLSEALPPTPGGGAVEVGAGVMPRLGPFDWTTPTELAARVALEGPCAFVDAETGRRSAGRVDPTWADVARAAAEVAEAGADAIAVVGLDEVGAEADGTRVFEVSVVR